MANDVKVLKLITGEEVIARVTEEKNNLLSLKKPMILKMLPPDRTTGQVGFALMPWMQAAKNEKVTISTDHVIAQDDPKDQAGKNYLENVTGLTL